MGSDPSGRRSCTKGRQVNGVERGKISCENNVLNQVKLHELSMKPEGNSKEDEQLHPAEGPHPSALPNQSQPEGVPLGA